MRTCLIEDLQKYSIGRVAFNWLFIYQSVSNLFYFRSINYGVVMQFHLDDYLKVIRPHLSPALVSDESLSDIEMVAHMFPGMISSFFGFECRLGDKNARADFLLCAKPDEKGREILADQNDQIKLPSFFFEQPAWNRIREFCVNWSDISSPLYENVKNVWLEFDLDKAPDKIPTPSFFFGSETIRKSSLISNDSQSNYYQHQWVIENALKIVRGGLVSPDIQSNLINCFNLLPSEAHVFQIGSMMSRNTDAVRICIRDISTDMMPKYLNDIGWEDSTSDLNRLLVKLDQYVDRVDLDLDIGATIFPKIGLECYLDQDPNYEPRWQLFLDELVTDGICIPEKRDSLLSYEGISNDKSSTDLWPPYLLEMSRNLKSLAGSIIYRFINHIKIVYQPDFPLEAKAYLAVDHQQITIVDVLKSLSIIQSKSNW